MTPYYQDEHVQIFHGDCREILPQLPKVDALITDPPYGIVNKFGEMNGNGTRTMQFPWDHNGITGVVLDALTAIIPFVDSSFVFCGADQFGQILECLRSEFTCKPAVWCKECPPPPGKGNWWPSGFELAIYGYRSGAFFGDEDPKRCNVFWYDSYRYGQPGKVNHPTQKPLSLMQRIVNAVIPPTGCGVDAFCGSGSTLLAAKLVGKRCIGIEIEERYCEIAAERMRQKVLF